MQKNYDLIIFDLENTLVKSFKTELLPNVAQWFENWASQENRPSVVIISNQGGVALRYWMEQDDFGDPSKFPTEEKVLGRLQGLARDHFADAPMYVSWAHQSSRTGKWSPTPDYASPTFKIYPGRGIVGSWSHDWRKPAPGMLLLAMDWNGAEADKTLMVGDLSTDREAATAAGCDFEWADTFFARADGILAHVRPYLEDPPVPPHAVCTVCERQVFSWYLYWVYSDKKGGERPYPVCPGCDYDFHKAVEAVEAAAAKWEKEPTNVPE